jgi:hypothetical protein
MKILLAEDYREFGFAIQSALEKRGHEVLWILGVREMPTPPLDIVLGIGECYTTVEFRFTDFGAALVDSILKGPVHGCRITRRLFEIGIKSCAIAGNDFANKEMEEQECATTSCPKHSVVSNLDAILEKLS